jgi:hypothetical protein
MSRQVVVAAGLISILVMSGFSRTGAVQAQGRGAQAPATPPTPRAQAPIDLTGNWVAIISEDWRWRMITPSRGDFPSIPLNMAAQKIAETWDPAKDEAAGEACKAYGAPGLMRGPTRLRITWLDDDTLKLETDYGMQTRLFEFRGAPAGQAPSLQGRSVAQWMFAGGGRGRGGARFGAMKAVTTNLKPGYLRKNGVPYSEKAVFTEYWDLHTETNGDKYIVVTNTVDDPTYLQAPWITSLHFKREPDGSKWNPEPCDARF